MRSFVLATAERATGMFAGTLSSVLMAEGADLFDADWKKALGIAGMSAVLSVAASLAKGRVGPSGPGFTETTTGVDKSGGS